jgi:hypothetical protein
MGKIEDSFPTSSSLALQLKAIANARVYSP